MQICSLGWFLAWISSGEMLFICSFHRPFSSFFLYCEWTWKTWVMSRHSQPSTSMSHQPFGVPQKADISCPWKSPP